MKHAPTWGLSLAFQRSFPHIYDHVNDLLQIKKDGSPQLSWPSWCYFPVGLSFDLLRHRYNYTQHGVEPFLLSALTAFNSRRRIVYLESEDFVRAAESTDYMALLQSNLYNLPHRCVYLSYPSEAGALGSFVYLDYNGPQEESLIFVLHLEPYHVEPVCFPLGAEQGPMENLQFDLERAVTAGKPAGVSDTFFQKAITLCRVNLRTLSKLVVRQAEGVLQ